MSLSLASRSLEKLRMASAERGARRTPKAASWGPLLAPRGERRQLFGAVTFKMTAFGGLGVSAGADTPALPAVYHPGRVSSLGKRFLKKFGSSYIREGHGMGRKWWYFSKKSTSEREKKCNFVGTLKKKGRKPSPHV